MYIHIHTVLFQPSAPHQCSADSQDEGKPISPPRVSHACGNSSVMPQFSNQRTSERAQLLSAMTHPSTVLNLDAKQSFVTPYIYIYMLYILYLYYICLYLGDNICYVSYINYIKN